MILLRVWHSICAHVNATQTTEMCSPCLVENQISTASILWHLPSHWVRAQWLKKQTQKKSSTTAHWSSTIPQNPIRQQQTWPTFTLDHSHFIGLRLLYDLLSIPWGTVGMSSMNETQWHIWPSLLTVLPVHVYLQCLLHCNYLPNTLLLAKCHIYWQRKHSEKASAHPSYVLSTKQ